MKPIVIKYSGEKDGEFSRQKLVESILINARSIKVPAGQAEEIANSVADDVERWLSSRSEVTTSDIHRIASGSLKKLHKDLAYLYNNSYKMI
jgi:transcriptional regulator NrdR family protein